MSEENGVAQPPWHHTRWFYWVVAIAIVLLLGGLLYLVWNRPVKSAVARKKAQQLYDLAKAEGFTMMSEKQTVESFERLFGADGGPVAKTAGGSLPRAMLAYNLNRTGEVNQRPGIIDERLLEFEYLVLQVYRPDLAPQFKDYMDGLKKGDTIVP